MSEFREPGDAGQPSRPAETTGPEQGAEAAEHRLPEELTPERIIDIASHANVEVFLDQFDTPHVWLPVSEPEGHWESLALRSKEALSHLCSVVERAAGELRRPRDIRRAIGTLELQAIRSGRRDLSNRMASEDGKVYIDLGDACWKMIALDRDGWRVCAQDRPRFTRARHHRALCDPVGNGDPERLFEFVSVEDEGERLLVISWAAAAFCSDLTRPMLVFSGPQGSAKSTRCRRLRDLIDPSEIPMLGDMELGSLLQTFQHHAVPCFENVSNFSRRQADMFCRAVTGNGAEMRRLFTNADQVLFAFRRAIIINGISIPSTRPDFLDRCLIVHCERRSSFTPLRELDRAYDEARPHLLGALLDVLVKTLGTLAETPPATEFRMADFAHFGRAVAKSLGRRWEAFDTAYRANIEQQSRDMVAGCTTAQLIKRFATSYPSECPWKGPAAKLLESLHTLAKRQSPMARCSDLPRSPRWLSTYLGEIAPALDSEGVLVRRLPRTNCERLWQISQKPQPSNVDLERIHTHLQGEENHE